MVGIVVAALLLGGLTIVLLSGTIFLFVPNPWGIRRDVIANLMMWLLMLLVPIASVAFLLLYPRLIGGP